VPAIDRVFFRRRFAATAVSHGPDFATGHQPGDLAAGIAKDDGKDFVEGPFGA